MDDQQPSGSTTFVVRPPGSAHPDPSSPRPGVRALWALSQAGDEQLQTLVDLVQDLCDVPLAALAIFEGSDYHLNVTAGIEPLVCDAQDTLCVQVMDTHDTVHVADVRADGRFDGSPYVDGRFMRIGFYASAPVYDPEGVMVGRLCVFDLEPRSLAETQRRALTAVAQDVTRIIELELRREADRPLPHVAGDDELLRVAAQVARDLRTPLMAVLTSLDVLAATEPDADPTRRRVLNSAHRSTRRLTGLVDDLLRLQGAAHTLDLQTVDLGELVDQVSREASLALRATGAVLHVGDLPTVVADARQLAAVLRHLLTNAVRHVAPGVVPQVGVDAERSDLGWRVRVSDNGTGLDADQRAHALDTAVLLAAVTGGRGTGLATVARVVRAHGGEVGLDESPSGGLAAWFDLPDKTGT